ncbi:MAG: 16S rRNA (guanine(966)-N(2))-methyltransferase RsmD [Proteobacteria bacterium]|nr:16S rRNA (guanine(966)-N(2))-methyltransferase RsmD [Pseudomonadota bacterium]
MRIIGGKAKGRRIFVPKGRIRPTSDMIKEALFNMLPSMEGKLFLDLFAGTGNIGLEALSRGAAKTVFVEVNTLFIEAIKRNLNTCGFDSNYEIVSAPVEKGLKLLGKRRDQFNIIFADPPYEKNLIKKTLHLLDGSDLISEDGIMIIQHSLREELEGDVGNFILTDRRRYGDTIISFFGLSC